MLHAIYCSKTVDGHAKTNVEATFRRLTHTFTFSFLKILSIIGSTTHLSMIMMFPQDLLIAVFNHYLPVEDRRHVSDKLCRVSWAWTRAIKAADQQLKDVYIRGQPNDYCLWKNVAYLRLQRFPALTAVTLQRFPRLTTITFQNLEAKQVKLLLHQSLPITIKTVNITASASLVDVGCSDSFANFICMNRHVKEFNFCNHFNALANINSEDVLTSRCPAQDPLLSTVRIGEFLSLQPHCYHATPNLRSIYRLRWINQCPFNSCVERFCWTQDRCSVCNQRKRLTLDCHQFSWALVCLEHAQRCLPLVPLGWRSLQYNIIVKDPTSLLQKWAADPNQKTMSLYENKPVH